MLFKKPNRELINRLSEMVGQFYTEEEFVQKFRKFPDPSLFYEVRLVQPPSSPIWDIHKPTQSSPPEIVLQAISVIFEGERLWSFVYQKISEDIDRSFLPPTWVASTFTMSAKKAELERLI